MSPDRWPRRPLFRLPFRRLNPHDIDDELRFHLQGRIEELMAQGLSRSEAEAEALRRFGDPTRIARELASVDSANERRRTMRDWIGTLGWELKLASRALTRRPGFLVVAVLTLALAIGANTAVFSALRGVVLQPLDVPEPERLMVLQQDAPALPLLGAQLAVPEVLDLNQETTLFAGAAGWMGRSFNLTGTGDPHRIVGVATIGPFFDIFRVSPLLGRFYRPEDSDGGNTSVVVLSYGFWQSTVGADPAMLGRTLELNGQSFEVIGVLPASFGYPRTGQVFLPYRITERDKSPVGRGIWGVTAVGRLQGGVPGESLRDRLRDVSRQWHERYGGYDPASGHVLTGQPLERYLAGELRGFLLALQAAVVVLLLIACANVANLQLVRATERGRELAVRSALGAPGSSLVRQLVLESGLVAVLGGGLGVLLAQGALGLIRRVETPELQALAGVRLDGWVLLYSAAIVVAAVILFGLLPAWRIRRPDLHQLMRAGTRGSTAGGPLALRLGAVTQVALSLVLVLGAGTLVRSLVRLLAIEPGFRPEQVTTFQLSLPAGSYPEPPARIGAWDGIAAQLRALPGVVDVGFVGWVPFSGGTNSSPFRVKGRAEDPGVVMHADMQFVHDRYFPTMGIPLLRGRLFEPTDVRGTEPVAIIDRQLAEQFFPGEDPVGQVINQGPDARIVGVVGSVKRGELQEATKAVVYYHYPQMSWINFFSVVLRSAGPAPSAGALQAAVSAVDPRLPVFDLRSMEDRIAGSLGARRIGTTVLTGFGLVALALALLGVYGVLSYSVSRRTRELGIRLALGARPAALVGGVTAGGLGLGILGLVIGLAGFAALGRWLGSLVYGVPVFDGVTLLAGSGLLAAGVALASLIPARRVVRVDPTHALREE